MAIEQTVERGYANLPTLTIGNLRTFFQTGNRERLEKQLEKVAAMTELGKYTPTFALLKGDFMMSDVLTTYQGRELVQNTLLEHEAALKTVSEADVFYARGLLAENYYDALRAYEAALEQDAFHFRANAALMVSYAFSGEFEKAAELGQFMKRVFKEDALPYFVDAWISLLQGEYDKSETIMASLSNQIRADKFEKLNGFLAVMKTIMQGLKKIEQREAGAGLMDWTSILWNLTKLGVMAEDPVLGEFGLNLPIINALVDSAQRIVTGYVEYLSPFGNRQNALRKMELAIERHPEAMFLNAYVMLKLMDALKKYQGEQLNTEVAKIALLSKKASQAPSIAPWVAHRYAKLIAVFLDIALQEKAQSQPAELSKDVHWLIDEARLSNHERNTFLPDLISNLPYELALPLLMDWLKHDNDNYTPNALLATLEFAQHNYVAALRAARNALAIKADERMQWIEQQCLLKMQEFVSD